MQNLIINVKNEIFKLLIPGPGFKRVVSLTSCHTDMKHKTGKKALTNRKKMWITQSECRRIWEFFSASSTAHLMEATEKVIVWSYFLSRKQLSNWLLSVNYLLFLRVNFLPLIIFNQFWNDWQLVLVQHPKANHIFSSKHFVAFLINHFLGVHDD